MENFHFQRSSQEAHNSVGTWQVQKKFKKIK